MELQVTSPSKTEILHIAWLEVTTTQGDYVIQPGHAPMILILASYKPILFRLKTGKVESISIRQGIIEVNRTRVKVIMNEIV